MKRIERRRPGRTASEKWFDIFKILFPGAALPRSPFAEHLSVDGLQAFIDYASDQRPSLLNDLIREQFSHGLNQREASIVDDYALIIGDALDRVVPVMLQQLGQSYRTMLSPNNPGTLPTVCPRRSHELSVSTDSTLQEVPTSTGFLPLLELPSGSSAFHTHVCSPVPAFQDPAMRDAMANQYPIDFDMSGPGEDWNLVMPEPLDRRCETTPPSCRMALN